MKNNVEKKDIIIKSIESFIDKKNSYIQVILLLIAVISGLAYDFVSVEIQTMIRYILSINIFMEIYVIQAKDSITQNKINLIAKDINAKNGGLRFEEDVIIDNYFENANEDFFISGIAPSRFIQKYKTNIEELLKNNKKVKVYILISNLDTVPENCSQYYGTKNNKNNQYDLLSKLSVVINSIENSETLKNAFKEKRLFLATSNIVFTTSFVAYNIFDSKSFHSSKIKITFYQQGEHQTGRLPCVSLDSNKNGSDMYPYFRNIINNQWRTADVFKDETELENFSNKLLCQLKLCKNKEH